MEDAHRLWRREVIRLVQVVLAGSGFQELATEGEECWPGERREESWGSRGHWLWGVRQAGKGREGVWNFGGERGDCERWVDMDCTFVSGWDNSTSTSWGAFKAAARFGVAGGRRRSSQPGRRNWWGLAEVCKSSDICSLVAFDASSRFWVGKEACGFWWPGSDGRRVYVSLGNGIRLGMGAAWSYFTVFYVLRICMSAARVIV